MIHEQVIQQRLQEQALKERMVLDAILILSSVEWVQDKLERKLLEFDEALENNKDGDLPRLRREILGCIRKLDREMAQMDLYMLKYRRLVDEKKELLPSARPKRPIYLRGVSPKQIRQSQS